MTTLVLGQTQTMEEKHPPGVFLDGTKINPLLTLAHSGAKEKIKELGGPFEYYRFPIGQYMLSYYLCPNSSVEVDSNCYLTLQQDNDEDIEDLDYCQVVFKDTVSQRCVFEGDCELVNVALVECRIIRSGIGADPDREKMPNILSRLEVIESEIHNAAFSAGAEVSWSWLHDVIIASSNRDKVRVDQCELQTCRFETSGIIKLDHVYAQHTRVGMNGLLKVAGVSWMKTRITGESIHIPGAMYFLEITLPKVRFFAYRTAADKWAIAPGLFGDWSSIDVSDPDIEVKLRAVLKERLQQDEESCLQYIYDCIDSRINVLTAINNYRSQELSHLTYPTGVSL